MHRGEPHLPKQGEGLHYSPEENSHSLQVRSIPKKCDHQVSVMSARGVHQVAPRSGGRQLSQGFINFLIIMLPPPTTMTDSSRASSCSYLFLWWVAGGG
jgi:hypothetical protein